MSRPSLSAGDAVTLRKLEEYYAARLDTLRAKNDGRLNADETARLRGRIFEVRQMLSLFSNEAINEDDATE